MLHQQPGLLEHLGLVEQLELALMEPVIQRRLRLHHQSQHADILRIHGVEGLGRLNGMRLQQLRTAQTGNGRDGKGNSAGTDLLAHLHDMGGSVALVHEGQNLVAAGLQAHIDHGQALGPQGAQLLLRPDLDAGGRGIAGDPLALGKQLPDRIQNHIQLLRLAHQGVAVRQEDFVHMAVHLPGHVEILQDFLQGPQGEALFLVHAAKGAGIVAASVGHLDNETVRLRGRTVNAAVISHTPSFSSAAIFRHTHSTSMAFSSSSTGGREGAMRRLLSWGSLP